MKTLSLSLALVSLALLATGKASTAQASACGGFSSARGADPSGDLVHQAALCMGFAEEDFESHASGDSIGQFVLGSVTIDVNLVDSQGVLLADDASAFAAGSFNVPGVMFHNALLNRSALSGAVGQVEFVFSIPVESFGGWLFDDLGTSDEPFTLEVLEVGGDLRIEGPFNLAVGTGIEGFFGVSSCVGIQRVRLGTPSSFLELDHLQVGGAIPASQALARNGSGVNRNCYSAARPALGKVWTAAVDVSAHPGAIRTIIVGYLDPLAGSPSPFGEILVDSSSPRVFRSYAVPIGGLSIHSCGIPASPCLAGLVTYSQAVIVGGGVELSNAVDLTIGH